MHLKGLFASRWSERSHHNKTTLHLLRIHHILLSPIMYCLCNTMLETTAETVAEDERMGHLQKIFYFYPFKNGSASGFFFGFFFHLVLKRDTSKDWSILGTVDISVHRALFIWAGCKERAHKREGALVATAVRFLLVPRCLAMLPSSSLHDGTDEDSCKLNQCSNK